MFKYKIFINFYIFIRRNFECNNDIFFVSVYKKMSVHKHKLKKKNK